jgi:RNA polymerase sigma-70 factor, ECF subfamily
VFREFRAPSTAIRTVATTSTVCVSPAAALAMIDALAKDLSGYFHFLGVRGTLLMDLDQPDEVREAFDRALALAKSPAEAADIRLQVDRLTKKKEAAG